MRHFGQAGPLSDEDIVGKLCVTACRGIVDRDPTLGKQSWKYRWGGGPFRPIKGSQNTITFTFRRKNHKSFEATVNFKVVTVRNFSDTKTCAISFALSYYRTTLPHGNLKKPIVGRTIDRKPVTKYAVKRNGKWTMTDGRSHIVQSLALVDVLAKEDVL